jgi:hypothetical protein
VYFYLRIIADEESQSLRDQQERASQQEGLVKISNSESKVFLTNKSSIKGSNIDSDSSTQPLAERTLREGPEACLDRLNARSSTS